MGQGAGVHPVVLQPRRRDRFAAGWMRQVHVEVGFFHQISQPLPSMVSAACGDSSEEGEATPVENTAIPSVYFQALEGWSTELVTRMDAVEQGEPSSDDPQQHAEYRQRRLDTLRALAPDRAQIETAAETTDGHLELIEGLQRVMNLQERTIESLQGASSANELFNGPLSGEIEMVGGRLLATCHELLDAARDLGIQVELFCGSSNE